MSDHSRVVLLTGVTRGLGRSLVDRFDEAGWTVVGCGRSAEAIALLRQTHSTRHHFEVVDVADAEQVQRWAAQVLQSGLVPDLLINNAAIIHENAMLWEIPQAEFSRVIDVNIKGVFHVIRAFVPTMVARQRGVIVNLSSGWGRSTSAKVAPYCATKYAIEGLTLALSQEIPSGMAAIPLNPGVIDTDMLRSCFGSGAAGYDGPDEWSRAAAPFLMQLSARHNGQSLTVPGY